MSPYVPIDWVNDVTALDEAHLDHIEQGVATADGQITALTGSKVDKDSVVAAGTRLVATKLLAGDAQPTMMIDGRGFITWGPGGAAASDTSLYRNGPGQLRTESAFDSLLDISARWGGNVVEMGAKGPTGQSGLKLQSDTSLYRSAAGKLRTDGTLDANALTINGVPVGTSSVTSAGPTGISLTNEWANLGGGYNWATASRTGVVVVLDGMIYKPSSTASPGELVGVISAGFRPQGTIRGIGKTNGGYWEVQISNTGGVFIMAWSGNPTDGDGAGWSSFTGISYPAYG